MCKQPVASFTIDETAAYMRAGKRTVYCFAASGRPHAFKNRWIAGRSGKVTVNSDEAVE